MVFFKKDAIGIYFGLQGISIVETKGFKVSNYNYSPFPKDLIKPGGEVSYKNNIFDAFLDNEVEITAFLNKAIRDSKTSLRNAVIAISPIELIVRFFELPLIPKNEIEAAVSLEIKKYIPFKIDEIVYDYQFRAKQKLVEILFTGIKSERLSKYHSLFAQTDISIEAIESSQFCLIRVLRLKNVLTSRDVALVIDMDYDEGVLSIIDTGFLCFTRDIKLGSSLDENSPELENNIFKLINEARVSIDYFRRQFVKKGVDKIIVLMNNLPSQVIDSFNKEFGLPIVYKNPQELLDIKEQYSLDILKAFGASLRTKKPFSLTLDLGKMFKLSASTGKEDDSDTLLAKLGMMSRRFSLANLLDSLYLPRPFVIRNIIIALLVLAGVFIYSNSQLKPFLKELETISIEMKSFPENLRDKNQKDLDKILQDEKNRLQLYGRNLIKGFSISERLNSLSDLILDGIWLTEISYRRENKTMVLRGYVYKPEEQEASNNLYKFIEKLKSSRLFSTNVKIELISMKNIFINNPKDGLQYKVVQFEIDVYLT